MTRRKKEEEVLQDSIIELAKLLGYLHYHTHDSRRSAKGFPDLVLVHERTGTLIFIEVKSETGTLSKNQFIWGVALNKVVQYHVLRPADWANGTVEHFLKLGAKQ